MRRITATGALVLSLLAAGGLHASAAPTPSVGCGEGGRGGAHEQDVVVGPLRISSAKRLAQDPPHFFEPQPGREVRSVKVPFILRASRRATISIDRRDRGRARLWFGAFGRTYERLTHGERAVRAEACGRDEVTGLDRERAGAHTGWPSGLLVTGPGCVRVVVALPDRDEPLRRTLKLGVPSCQTAGAG